MDTTKQHDIEQELKKQLADNPIAFEFLQHSCFDGLIYLDMEDQTDSWVSSNFWSSLGYESKTNTHLLTEWKDALHGDDLDIIETNLSKQPKDNNGTEVRFLHQDGSIVWMKMQFTVLANPISGASRVLVAMTNITPLKETQQRLKEKEVELYNLTRHDTHTSLYNHFAFAEIFEQQLLIAAREHMPISLALVDVDNFKDINESQGQTGGDEILLSVANKLRSVARDSDVISRFGVDEYIILMFNTNHREAQLAAERLRMGVEEDVMAGSKSVTVSVGVSTFGEKSIAGIDLSPAEIYEKMLQTVNGSLSRAKSNGRNQVCY